MVDASFWKGKRVFLTGNTGFKGSWLSIWLSSMGAIVRGYSLPPPTSPSLYVLAQVEKLQDWVQGDVRDREAVASAMGDFRPEIVLHMAAQPLVRESYRDPVGTYATNVMGTVHLLEAVRNCSSVKAVVNVTTDKCYENQEWPWGYRENEPMGGHDPYSNSKGCSELVTMAYRRSFFASATQETGEVIALASARAGNVIGGGDFAKDRLIPDLLRAIQSGAKAKIRSPFAIRPWQHVLEPLSGYLTLAQALYKNGSQNAEAWNFGPRDDDARPVQWIVERLCSLIPTSKGYEIDSQPQPHEATYLKLDISKSRARLGWAPRWSLDETLAKIVEWDTWYLNGQPVLGLCQSQIAEFERCQA